MFVRLCAVALLVVSTACGGGGGASSGATDPPATAAPTASAEPTEAAQEPAPVEVDGANTVKGQEDASGKKNVDVAISIGDYFYGPTFLKVDPGAKITIAANNDGTHAHTFTVDPAKVDKLIRADKSAKLTVTMPKAGALRFYCTFHPSMAGAFYSEDGQKVRG